MAAVVRRGLDARKKLGHGGSISAIARARDIAGGNVISVDSVNRMQMYFDGHPEDAKAAPDSAAGIAYLLHGGNAGKSWCEAIRTK
jgi:hypothetical protein